MTLFLKKWLFFWYSAFCAFYGYGFGEQWEEDMDDLELATDLKFIRAMERLSRLQEAKGWREMINGLSR